MSSRGEREGHRKDDDDDPHREAKASPAASKAKPRRKKSRKPAGMPRRALSAYNIFFQEQRLIFLRERNDRTAANTDDDNNSNLFNSMAKCISKRWRELKPEEIEKYKKRAVEDATRYSREMEVYHQKISKHYNEGNESNQAPAAPATESAVDMVSSPSSQQAPGFASHPEEITAQSNEAHMHDIEEEDSQKPPAVERVEAPQDAGALGTQMMANMTQQNASRQFPTSNIAMTPNNEYERYIQSFARSSFRGSQEQSMRNAAVSAAAMPSGNLFFPSNQQQQVASLQQTATAFEERRRSSFGAHLLGSMSPTGASQQNSVSSGAWSSLPSNSPLQQLLSNNLAQEGGRRSISDLERMVMQLQSNARHSELGPPSFQQPSLQATTNHTAPNSLVDLQAISLQLPGGRSDSNTHHGRPSSFQTEQRPSSHNDEEAAVSLLLNHLVQTQQRRQEQEEANRQFRQSFDAQGGLSPERVMNLLNRGSLSSNAPHHRGEQYQDSADARLLNQFISSQYVQHPAQPLQQLQGQPSLQLQLSDLLAQSQPHATSRLSSTQNNVSNIVEVLRRFQHQMPDSSSSPFQGDPSTGSRR